MSTHPQSNFVESGRKIVCVGRNYAEHAKELGNEVPTEPLLFLKPTSSYVTQGSPIVIPAGCDELHHEVELGVVIGERAKNVSANDALSHVAGFVLALDMTARDIQSRAKAKGHPWSVAKGYDTFCPVGEFIPRAEFESNLDNITLALCVDGAEKQRGNTSQMIWSVLELVAHVSTIFTLTPGDVILTGTPSGVGPVRNGQQITASVTIGDSSKPLTQITFDVAKD